ELDLAVKLDPETVEAHAVLALLYFSQNKLEEAAYEYEIALKNASILEPRNTDIYKNLGIIYLRQKKYDLAQEVYRKVIGITPDDSEAYYYLGNALDQLNKRREAYKFFEKAIELKPDYADALNYLGYLYAEENIKLDKAEELIKMALALQPNNGAYVDSLGWVYFRKEKYQDSVQELERASRLAQDPVIFDHLGDAYFKINDRVKAKINWEKALELDASLSKVSNKIKELTKVKK
ncbi:MAG: tetratricopeptide repeat protein, partial [Candidatus Omnitrophica bacterium]|nr:tetratricopeptide repeat protein [Candidatus Omnitrophota bacterium]